MKKFEFVNESRVISRKKYNFNSSEQKDVYVNGVQLMRVPEEEVIPTLRKVFPGEEGVTDGENYMYIKYALSVFVTEGQIRGVFVGKKNYFDFLKEDLEDLGHSGLMKF